jgi:inner membrane protein
MAVGLLSLLLLIPLGLVEGVITERNARRISVETEVAESSAGSQHLVGPILVLTYQERVESESLDEKTGRTTRRAELVDRGKVIEPRELVIEGQAKVEPRRRGLYKTQVYRLEATLKGRFQIPPGPRYPAGVTPGPAYLVLGVSDRRGLLGSPSIEWQGRKLDFQAATGQKVLPGAIEAPLGVLEPGPALDLPFSMSLDLLGSKHLSVAPVAGLTRMALKSGWPSPSFQGRFLPLERTVDAAGFQAVWQVNHLARDLGAILSQGGKGPEAFAVEFIDPLNIYLQTERAVKYGVLFVLLTLGGFFLFEVLRRLPIHPVQYGLVGLALGVFFLLLLSLSERMSFASAYAISALACVTLLGVYLAGVLRSWRQGGSFALGVGVLYGALFGLLASEDNALLLGALLLFTLLGAVMVGTRSVNWYGLGNSQAKPGGQAGG